MPYAATDKYLLAQELVEKTGKHVFLTGKAGTGKTTFLHQLRNQTLKRHVVVAPTGVAAINAHGVTIHSFFQLPLRPILPNELNEETLKKKELFKFYAEKQNIIRNLDLLIIDEISMVRADVLDAIDFVLRKIRRNNRPFGNVQLLLIGDLYQLAPVVRNDEWQLLSEYYESPYFFESHALKQTEYVTIELDRIFRQQDEDFIRILNKVREGLFDEDVYETLNSRYVPDFDEKKYKNYILLTTHNTQAEQVNQSKLNQLQGEQRIYEATIRGDFPKEVYPTDASLALKVGAQVMFLRNDTTENKQYYNGKVGKIVELGEYYIKVKTDDDTEIAVEPALWENIKYSLDPETQSIKEQIVGTYVQYPIKLAWAITIHKSQGLTFDRVAIDAQHAFAHGQVYVALSRCRSLDGLILISKIKLSSVRVNTYLHNFCNTRATPTLNDVVQAQKDFQFQLIEELFSFDDITYAWRQYLDVLQSYQNTLTVSPIKEVQHCFTNYESKIVDVAAKFLIEIERYKPLITDSTLPDQLQERIKKAVAYFTEQLSLSVEVLMHTPYMTDEKKSEKKISLAFNKLMKSKAQKKFFLLAVREGFSLEKHFKARSSAAQVDILQMFANETKGKPSARVKAGTRNELFQQLKTWRSAIAAKNQLNEESILTTLTLVRLSLKKPSNENELTRLIKLPDQFDPKWIPEILQIIHKNDTINRQME
ncbi:MAG: AAA family ATPase [Bacteroidales bacterium]